MITQQQKENIQIDYGLVYVNFGVAGERRLAPTRGGGTFVVTPTYRDIEFDGTKGKEKGMQILDSVTASLTVPLMDTSMENLALAMPYATLAGNGGDTPYTLTMESSAIGVVPNSAYFANITLFAKVIGGGYKKITLYNPMNEGAFSFAAAPKSEGIINMEIQAHWDSEDDDADLYKIEDVATIGADTTPPTVVTVPDDAASAVAVSANLTATFSEAVRQGDINSNNFVLVKASDGTIVAGTLAYTSGTYLVTFDPTTNLDASTAYIWMITNVRDLAGNKMAPKIVNFATA